MSIIRQIVGRGIPLAGNDIDTDRIIPARFLRCVTFDGLGEQVFVDDRAQAGGKHPFDLPEYQGANILVVNRNFGCGSSREHAPQSLARWGIQAIVAESFAEIFFGNCLAIGIPCATAAAATIAQLQQSLQANPLIPLQLDLETQQLIWGEEQGAIAINEAARQALLSGTWDNCGQLASNTEQVRAKASQLPYFHWEDPISA